MEILAPGECPLCHCVWSEGAMAYAGRVVLTDILQRNPMAATAARGVHCCYCAKEIVLYLMDVQTAKTGVASVCLLMTVEEMLAFRDRHPEADWHTPLGRVDHLNN